MLIAILTDQRHARCLDLDLSVNLLMDSGCPLRSPSKKDEDRQPDARERALCVRQRDEKAIKLDQASDLFSGSGSTSSMSSGCDTHRIYSKLADRATGCHRDLELARAFGLNRRGESGVERKERLMFQPFRVVRYLSEPAESKHLHLCERRDHHPRKGGQRGRQSTFSENQRGSHPLITEIMGALDRS